VRARERQRAGEEERERERQREALKITTSATREVYLQWRGESCKVKVLEREREAEIWAREAKLLNPQPATAHLEIAKIVTAHLGIVEIVGATRLEALLGVELTADPRLGCGSGFRSHPNFRQRAPGCVRVAAV